MFEITSRRCPNRKHTSSRKKANGKPRTSVRRLLNHKVKQKIMNETWHFIYRICGPGHQFFIIKFSLIIWCFFFIIFSHIRDIPTAESVLIVQKVLSKIFSLATYVDFCRGCITSFTLPLIILSFELSRQVVQSHLLGYYLAILYLVVFREIQLVKDVQ